ncbi:MAG: isopentenyl-diphosphate Delta-isomerase [Bacillota bacterium]|nr:isopentenyl-diphosphate Delta-isomerase [Bacillota bacterium]
MEDKLILVNLSDEEIGTCGKLDAHRRGLLHRAFSIFVFTRNQKTGKCDRLLIQRRAEGKYHSGGKWANSCCSHPRQGESLEEATARRLPEETGISTRDCPLEEAGSFVYRAVFDNGLTEYEYDHVFTGVLSLAGDEAGFVRNPEEADEMLFADLDSICRDVERSPDQYAPWFITALPIAIRNVENR